MKDEKITYCRIKIKRIRERKGTRYYCKYRDKLWCVDVKDYSGAGFAFCETTLKKAFQQLKSMMHL